MGRGRARRSGVTVQSAVLASPAPATRSRRARLAAGDAARVSGLFLQVWRSLERFRVHQLLTSGVLRHSGILYRLSGGQTTFETLWQAMLRSFQTAIGAICSGCFSKDKRHFGIFLDLLRFWAQDRVPMLAIAKQRNGKSV